MSNTFRAAFITLPGIALALVGAGCERPQDLVAPPPAPAELKRSTFDGLTAAEATARIHLVRGSVLEMRQTIFGFGAKLGALLAGEDKEGTRIVVIDRFAPREVAGVNWRLNTTRETDASVKARADAAKQKKPAPESVYERFVFDGSIEGFNLKDAHTLYLPTFWPDKDSAGAFGTSGLWLSADVFDSLSRNRVGTLDFGLFDPALQGVFAAEDGLGSAIGALKTHVKTIEDRVDVNLLKGEADLVDWPLRVNGEEIKVQAIKARNWFGEIVVLNSEQNPLVLKLTVNPLAAGVTDLLKGIGVLSTAMGYEVTSLSDVVE
ncbi:hypothetical protein HY479_00235 [Candidatus Uhrbacteria bacterium]|nr:hypothetical protein [Candidatus Uhrbacteria bacterium]